MPFENRVVEYPGRVILAPVSGEENTYDMTRAEGEVTEEGTPLNAENLNSVIQEMVDDALSTLSNAITVDSNGNVSFRNLQSGTAKVTVKKANVTSTVNVTFPQAFTKTPKVVITPVSTAPGKVSVGVSNITTTGFTVNLYRTNAVDTTIKWIAHA